MKQKLPTINAPLSPVHANNRAINPHFAEMYEKAGLKTRKNQ